VLLDSPFSLVMVRARWRPLKPGCKVKKPAKLILIFIHRLARHFCLLFSFTFLVKKVFGQKSLEGASLLVKVKISTFLTVPLGLPTSRKNSAILPAGWQTSMILPGSPPTEAHP